MPRVVHFEIHAGDPDRAVNFYKTLFGWSFQKWEGPMEYWMVITGPDDQPGINGGLMRRHGEIDGQAVIAYVCTVNVEDVDASLQTALANAAQELGKDVSTLRRWIAQGAPTARHGVSGRNRGALVVVEDLQRWRAKSGAKAPDAADFLTQLERILADYHRGGDHRLVGLRDDAAKALYEAQLEYIAGRLNRADE